MTKKPIVGLRKFGEIVVCCYATSAILNAIVAEDLPGPGTVFLQELELHGTQSDHIQLRARWRSYVRDDNSLPNPDTVVQRQDGGKY